MTNTTRENVDLAELADAIGAFGNSARDIIRSVADVDISLINREAFKEYTEAETELALKTVELTGIIAEEAAEAGDEDLALAASLTALLGSLLNKDERNENQLAEFDRRVEAGA